MLNSRVKVKNGKNEIEVTHLLGSFFKISISFESEVISFMSIGAAAPLGAMAAIMRVKVTATDVWESG